MPHPAAKRSAISWNIVEKNVTLDERTKEKLTRKIAALARLLVHFPPETLHLQVVLDQIAKTQRYTARLTLRLPSNILHAEKSSPDLFSAINSAMAAIEREVKSFKRKLRDDYHWKRPAYRGRLATRKAIDFAEPLGRGKGPQTHADVVRQLLDSHQSRLLAHARRQIRMAELAGDLPTGAIDPADIVDEVARVGLADPNKKPRELTYELWFYRLLAEEFSRQHKQFREEARQRVEPAATTEVETADEAEGYDAEQPLDIITRELEPEETLPEEQIPDPGSLPPDLLAARDDLIQALQQAIRHWPRYERDVFELHFFAGLDAAEIAMIHRRRKQEIEALIDKLQRRVRDLLRETVGWRQKVWQTFGRH